MCSSDLAAVSGVSRRLLERRFVALLGRAPADEIRRAHLDRARQLMIETDCPLAQVAELAGFGSQAYFADLFRRHFNLTPFQYRKNNRVRAKGFA